MDGKTPARLVGTAPCPRRQPLEERRAPARRFRTRGTVAEQAEAEARMRAPSLLEQDISEALHDSRYLRPVVGEDGEYCRICESPGDCNPRCPASLLRRAHAALADLRIELRQAQQDIAALRAPAEAPQAAQVERFLEEIGDATNWVAAIGPMGDELGGWCGSGDLRTRALDLRAALSPAGTAKEGE